MAYNRVGTPKFYIDAMLLARQWGQIETENTQGKYYLNPSKVTPLSTNVQGTNVYFSELQIIFKSRQWFNSITHLFLLGHNGYSEGLRISASPQPPNDPTSLLVNGWSKIEFDADSSRNTNSFTLVIGGQEDDVIENILIGDISAGWSFEMPHSSDLELTQSFSNESIKTQTTKGGHTLTNTGWNNPPMWIREQWQNSFTTDFDQNPLPKVGRRSWNLKFSYISDTDIFRPYEVNPLYSSQIDYTGIFSTIDGGASWSILDNFMNKVYHSTNGFQLPLIFQPNKDVEEYAICRINSDTASFKQVANNVYDISLDITEVW